jgi:hypothetical protein
MIRGMKGGGDLAGRPAMASLSGQTLTAAIERQAGRGQGPQQGQRGYLRTGFSGRRPVEGCTLKG